MVICTKAYTYCTKARKKPFAIGKTPFAKGKINKRFINTYKSIISKTVNNGCYITILK